MVASFTKYPPCTLRKVLNSGYCRVQTGIRRQSTALIVANKMQQVNIMIGNKSKTRGKLHIFCATINRSVTAIFTQYYE